MRGVSIFHLKSIGHAGECIYCTYIGVKLSINMMNTSTVASLYKVKSSSVLAEPDQDTKILLVSYYFEVTNRRLELSIRVDDHNSINSNLSLLTIFSAEYHLPRTAPPLSRGPCKLILNTTRLRRISPGTSFYSATRAISSTTVFLKCWQLADNVPVATHDFRQLLGFPLRPSSAGVELRRC